MSGNRNGRFKFLLGIKGNSNFITLEESVCVETTQYLGHGAGVGRHGHRIEEEGHLWARADRRGFCGVRQVSDIVGNDFRKIFARSFRNVLFDFV